MFENFEFYDLQTFGPSFNTQKRKSVMSEIAVLLQSSKEYIYLSPLRMNITAARVIPKGVTTTLATRQTNR